MAKKYNIFIANLFLSIFTFFLIIFNIPNNNHIIFDSSVKIWGIITVFIYIVSFISYVKINGTIISIYLLFLLYLFFSSCGQTFLNIIGFTDHWFVDVYKNFSNLELVNFLQFQILCVMFMNIAALWANLKFNKKIYRKKIKKNAVTINVNSKFLIILYYVILFLVISMLLTRIQYRMSFGYSTAIQGGFDDKLSFLWVFFAIITALICFGNYGVHTKNVIIISLIISVICFLLGTRTYAITLLGILLFYYGKTIRKNGMSQKFGITKMILIFIIAFFALGTINIFTQLRTMPLSTLKDLSILDYFNPLNSIVDTISEMGASASTILRTMRCIDNVGHQQTILYDVFESVIPHFILNVFFQEPLLNAEGLAHWVTFNTGSLLAGTSSMGYSCLAEAFLNYGMFGCIFMFIHGYLIVWLEKKAEYMVDCGYILFPALAVTYISKQIFFARAQLDLMVDPVRYMILIVLFCWIMKNMLKEGKKY